MYKRKKLVLFTPIVFTVLLSSCQLSPTALPPTNNPSTTGPAKATISPQGSQIKAQPQISENTDFMVMWIDQLRLIIQRGGMSPPVASRLFAYAGIAMHETQLVFSPQQPKLVNQLTGYETFKTSMDIKNIEQKLVLHNALYTLVSTLVPNLQASQRQILQQLDNKIRQDLALTPAIRDTSRELGRVLGLHVADWAKNDRYGATRTQQYSLPSPSQNPANWVPTELGKKPLEPFWGQLRPFILDRAETCYMPPHYSFSSTSDSDFYRQASEVLETSRNLTAQQTAIARWWADNPGQTATPPGHWMAISGQLARERILEPDQTARLFAVLAMTMADAFINCWRTKYEVNLLRPKTYIRQYLAVPGGEPLLITPSFPEYPSGHSVGSAAAAEVLTEVFGDSEFIDRTHENVGMTARSYKDFKTAAQEAGVSRLYGGIHFRDAIENGLKQGSCVGKHVLDALKSKGLQP